MVLVIAFATFVSTLLGGLFALKFSDKLHLVLGFSAGAVIGVALFDLLPESINLGNKFFTASTTTTLVALGFILYLLLDRIIFIHFSSHAAENDAEHASHAAPERGTLGAGSLSIHSFLDGLAIGLAFQVSATIGAVVAFAVLTHDFSDGINTVNLVLKNQGERAHAFRWLLVDAVAPVLGAASTLFFSLPEYALAIILALFSGFFLYIGAADLIPESHHRHPRFLTTAMTMLGMAVLFVAVHFASL
ncbi:MAG: ZIP family metal transporter [Patescibacteria group bacterium]|nr:ZIP family metal transporter [Patescibacteria group bacterium]